MTRKKSDTVDFFPHHCKPSKEEQIIQRRHGNDGYVVYNKFRELLGDNDGHYIDSNDEILWTWIIDEYIGIPESVVIKVINTMILVKLVDKELWKRGIIWSDNFVNLLSGVYINRKRDAPSKPIPKENQTELSLLRSKSKHDSISTVVKTQSKEKKTKHRKVKKTSNPDEFDPVSILPFFKDKDFQDAWKEHRIIRKSKKGSLKPRADKSKLNKLLKFSKGRKDIAIAILDRSSESGWTDVFPLPENQIPEQKPIAYGYECPTCDNKIRKPKMADYHCSNKDCAVLRESGDLIGSKMKLVKHLYK